jgi:hypothetical protein
MPCLGLCHNPPLIGHTRLHIPATLILVVTTVYLTSFLPLLSKANYVYIPWPPSCRFTFYSQFARQYLRQTDLCVMSRSDLTGEASDSSASIRARIITHYKKRKIALPQQRLHIRFEVFTAVVMKSIVFWDMTPCSPLSVNRRFGRTYRSHLQGRRNKFNKKPASKQVASYLLVSCWTYFFDPEDGGDMFLRNVGWQRTTRRHIPEYDTLQRLHMFQSIELVSSGLLIIPSFMKISTLITRH